MIKETIPISMPEAVDYLKSAGDSGKEMKAFIKKFNTLKPEQVKEMREKITALNILKIDEFGISKLIDMLPENAEEINKVLIGAGLDEEEIKKVVEIVKEFK